MAQSRRPDYDAFRAIAAGMVAYSHWFPEALTAQSFMWGRTGLVFFFVLSGMFIGRLLEKLSVGEVGSRLTLYYDFMCARLLRIVPPYFFLIMVVWLSGYIYMQDKLTELLLFFSNIDILSGALYGHSVHLWSIAVEVHFYALWGFFYIASSQRRRWIILFSFVLTGPLWRFYAAGIDSGGWVLASFVLPGCIDSFAIGLLLVRSRQVRFPEIVLLASAFCALAFTFLVGFRPLEALDTPWFVTFYDISVAFFAAGVILTLDKYRLRVCSAFIVTKVLGPLGLISYGFYLWHYFAIPFWDGLDISVADFISRAILYTLFTLCLAVVSWLLIEKPSSLLRHRVSP
ncbi:acyltransferase family protein [Pseudomonas sp. NPDC047961]